MIYRTPETEEYYFHEGCFILEHLNDPKDKGASIARARVEVGKETALHALKATTERYLILEGTGLIQIGNDFEELNQGNVAVIPAGVAQKIKNTGTTDLIFLAICTPRFVPESYIDMESQK